MNASGNKVAVASTTIAPGQRYVRAVFDFTPSVPEELQIDAGDVVKVLGKIDDFWIHGLKLHNGESGQFPKDFIKDITIPRCLENETLLYALDTFYPEASEDLPFEKGEVIVLERKINNEWGSGRSATNLRGMFPLNYTERLLPLTISSLKQKPRVPKPLSPVKRNHHQSPPVKSPSKVVKTTEGLGHARALMNLTAQLEEELSFCTGDEIVITEVLDDGLWYRGRHGEDTGSFPASFVELLGPLKPARKTTPPSPKIPLMRTGSKAWKEEKSSVTITNVTNNNNTMAVTEVSKPKLMNHGVAASDYHYAKDVLPSSITGAKKPENTVQKLPKKIMYTVRALHKFTGSTEQELSFEEGILIAISKEVDDHWLMGMIDGREGFVPKTYVSEGIGKQINSSQKPADELKKPESARKDDAARVGTNNLKTEGVSRNINYVKVTGTALSGKRHVYTAPNPDKKGAADGAENHASKDPDGMAKSKKAFVVYDYQARNQFDLSISVGDTVWVSHEVDKNWCQVKTESGQDGIVPTSYIQFAVDGDDSNPVPPETPVGEYMTVDGQRKAELDTGRANGNDYVLEPHAHSKTAGGAYMGMGSNATMPVLFESTATETGHSHVATPKPYGPSRPYHRMHNNANNSHALQKSLSVDNSRPLAPINGVNINRSRSNPHSHYGHKTTDPHVQLKAWQSARRKSHDDHHATPVETPGVFSCATRAASVKVPSQRSESTYETPISKTTGFDRSAGRSASMREQRSPNACKEDVESIGGFTSIKSDSDLTVESTKGKPRPRRDPAKPRHPHSTSTTSLPTSLNQARQKNPGRFSDSVSTTSTESSSSYSDSRTSHSTRSDISGHDSTGITPNKVPAGGRTPQRSAPPVPPHYSAERTIPAGGSSESPDVNYPPSPWSPPVPRRKQSLHRDLQKSQPDGSSATLPQTTGQRTVPPARPAPKLPPGRDRKASTLPSNQTPKKVPPMRPANPPTASPCFEEAKAPNGKEAMRSITSRETKDRMEKLRLDIEEYSRMKRDLENLYKGTLDGKERREISENMEFVKANLKRLRKEFEDIIDKSDQDHIYESIDVHRKPPPRLMDESGANTFAGLPAPPLPPAMESPGTIRRKRQEKRLLVVKEIVNTERDFLMDITVTIDDIMNDLNDREIGQNMVSTLFGNIVEVRQFSEGFLDELEDALATETHPTGDPDAVTIGQVFIDNIPRMKEVYMTYCQNHDDAIATLEKCESDQEFMQAVANCLENVRTKVNVFDLGSFLIKPVQRILKYPLLIGELIKLTDKPAAHDPGPDDLDKLVLAAKMMQDVANDINESRRTKDLVRKYKNATNEGITEKLGRISIKSLKKKSTRMSRRLGNVTGITPQGRRDAQFDEIEKRFKTLERALKLFKTNVTTYCDKCRDALYAELSVAKAIVDIVLMPERTHPVAKYQAMVEKMSGPIYRQFHDQVQLRAISPVSSLLVSFEAPQAIVEKRYDKLIDYERLQKNSDSKEKIQAAKYDYEALNKSLLEELPKLSDLGVRLLSSCTAIFAQVHRDFERKLLDVLKPLLSTIQQAGDREPKIPSNIEIQDRFHPAHAEAVHVISRLQIVPTSFGTFIGANRSSTDPTRRSRPPVAPKMSIESGLPRQLPQDCQALLQKYERDQLFVAVQTYNASQLMDISCCEGDVIAVLKRQDPMGNAQRWFVDKGGNAAHSTGFLPSTMITPYNPVPDDARATSVPPPAYTRSSAAKPKPTPVPRQKSPTPSFKSTSSSDSTGAPKPLQSPFTVRQKLETLNRGETLPMDGNTLTDADILDVFAEEDEIFDDTEYGEVLATSPKSTKQHFRAEYEFKARSELELTVGIGDIVKLIMAHDTDGNTEWWLVSNSEGKQGYVPFNYLTKAEYL